MSKLGSDNVSDWWNEPVFWGDSLHSFCSPPNELSSQSVCVEMGPLQIIVNIYKRKKKKTRDPPKKEKRKQQSGLENGHKNYVYLQCSILATFYIAYWVWSDILALSNARQDQLVVHWRQDQHDFESPQLD